MTTMLLDLPERVVKRSLNHFLRTVKSDAL
jgi:hypothetical protein